MDEIRKLVYEDRSTLDAFNVSETGSLNNLVYDKWLIKRAEIEPLDIKYKEHYLKAFNDAYYICTLALMLPQGSDLIPSRISRMVERPSVVFPMVHLYLSKLTHKSKGIVRFLSLIETASKRMHDWECNLVELQETVSGHAGSIDTITFGQRKLTVEVLSGIDWKGVTDEFKKGKIEQVIRNYARDSETWRLMCEAVKEAAKSYDYEFGFEEITQEGVDEDGFYVQTIKVPKDPYDHDGNDILDPLKRAGVYQFCDELKEKYGELAVTAQPFEDDICPKQERPVRRRRSKKSSKEITTAFNVVRMDKRSVRLECLYNDLKRKQFIASDTDQKTFIDTFMGIPPADKIVWTGSIAELHYMFDLLYKKGWVKQLKGTSKWQAVCSCFRIKADPDVEELNTKQFVHGKKKPAGPERIDNIILWLDPDLDLAGARDSLEDDINELFADNNTYDPQEGGRYFSR